jgi:hypothetical protein
MSRFPLHPSHVCNEKLILIKNFQSGWTITVDIVIGPRDGISYKAEQGSVVSLKDFETHYGPILFRRRPVYYLDSYCKCKSFCCI